MSSGCLVKPIPPLCVGASATSVTYSSGFALSEDVISYASTAAVYGIGKLATQLPSFNPAWGTLEVYGFNSDTVASAWEAQQYSISGGRVVGSPLSTSGGVCAADSYNTADKEYTLVSWDGLVTDGWTGAGGYCMCEGTCSSDYIPAGGGIASPPAIAAFDINVSVPAVPATPGGSGGSGGALTECNIFVGVVTVAPNGGFGLGAVASAVFKTDGSYSYDATSGGNISVVFPYIS